MGKIKTYNPKEVTMALGNHIVTGYPFGNVMAAIV